MKRIIATIALTIATLFSPVPAQAVGSFDCNPYRINENAGTVFRYCRESPHGGMYYVDIKLFRFYEGAPQYKWKEGTYETPSVGNGSWVGYNQNVWSLVDWKTREICATCKR